MRIKNKSVHPAKYSIVLASVAREKIYHGHGLDRRLVFEIKERSFWDTIDVEEFGQQVKRTLTMLTIAPGI